MSERPIGFAIIGCGLIGKKRAAALGSARLVACADLDKSRAEAVARTWRSPSGVAGEGVLVTTDWRAAIGAPGVDAVIVATTNDMLAEVSAGTGMPSGLRTSHRKLPDANHAGNSPLTNPRQP